MTSIVIEMEHLLKKAFLPAILEITDDSSRHQGHQEAGKGQETHFTVLMVSSEFQGKSLLQRHRAVQNVLKELLHSKIHALSLKTLTPQEHQNVAL
ncbi:MAG: BolA family transcriptional regulator [Caedimonas sp.]|nr:BolA family transcriptional regulator [Caedimonas sp.]